jgi:hypothetical protein
MGSLYCQLGSSLSILRSQTPHSAADAEYGGGSWDLTLVIVLTVGEIICVGFVTTLVGRAGFGIAADCWLLCNHQKATSSTMIIANNIILRCFIDSNQ